MRPKYETNKAYVSNNIRSPKGDHGYQAGSMDRRAPGDLLPAFPGRRSHHRTYLGRSATNRVTWQDLPLTDFDGVALAYTVKEVDAKGNDATPAHYVKQEQGLR